MCGIFGFAIRGDAGYGPGFIRKSLTTLAHLSESRGKDSSGLVFRNGPARELQVLKGAVSLRYLLKREEVDFELERALRQPVFTVMGHSRLVTNGSQRQEENNQPVVKDGIIGIHNGIIVNEDALWSRHPDLRRTHETDTEVMLALIRKFAGKGGVARAVSKMAEEVFGTFSTAFFMEDSDTLTLATNNGSLYALDGDAGLFAFASEGFFLKELAATMELGKHGGYRIHQVVPGTGIVFDLERFRVRDFAFSPGVEGPSAGPGKDVPFRILVRSLSDGKPQAELVLDPARIAVHPRAKAESTLLENNIERIDALRRCAKCLLPETFPFIEYDGAGVCNYCGNYVIKNQPKSAEELFELVEPYRSRDGSVDCIIPFSGGRDSTFTLHVAKNVLKLNPVAFTYDWGMVNDLARRNIARVCGKLRVENILVSADIAWKRGNIRKNILAWLKKPRLGMVPLFMAGDKFFYYYTDQVKKQTGVRLNIWGINPLENTDFKVGFLGVPPDHRKERIYSLSAKRKAKLLGEVVKSVLENPAYVNRSVWDSIGSFLSRSVASHRDYYHLFDYYRWDEAEIEKLVLDEYRWETAIDTKTTWRIGDGTAAFYNYIYYTVAGFSEYDTFRSNQIREGALSREEGLRLVREENRPRYPSLKWYTEILDLDFQSTIKRINEIPKLYR